MTVITVPGREGSTYPVHIGPLDGSLFPAAAPPLPCVTDDHVWALHGERVSALLPLDPFFVPRGEAGKCWSELQRLIDWLANRDHPRTTPLVALGGGAVGDLAGLAAALFKRGCPVVQVPTTLLAMVDSSVGGKTAIDAAGQKNLVGAFHPPIQVHADPAFLTTLDVRELRAGVAETLKYGLIDDPDFYGWMTGGGARQILSGDSDAAARAIATAVTAKARLVDGDLEDRSGQRALLNLGHTFGHAIESVAGLGTVLHGEAVAVGMVLAARYSERTGMAPDAPERIADRIAADLAALDLPTTLADVGIADGTALHGPMLGDKKNDDGALTLVLLRGIGQAMLVRDVDPADVRAFLAAL